MNGGSMRVVSFVAASSGSGKTTLIEKIVRILKARGRRLAVVKHASEGFEIDTPGKDSWRFGQAGADVVMLAGPDRFALVRKETGERSLDDYLLLAGDVDIVLFEGFKQSAVNKIEVFRAGISGERPLALDDPTFLAMISDARYETAMPWFGIDDAEGVAEFILKNVAMKL